VFLSWQDNSLGNSRAASGFAVTISAVESGDFGVAITEYAKKKLPTISRRPFQPSETE